MRTAAVLGLLTLLGCASTQQPAVSSETTTVRVIDSSGAMRTVQTVAQHRPRVTTVEIPLDQVWRALPAAYNAVGIEVATQDVSRGVIGNPGFRARRRLGDTSLGRYLDCGTTQGGPSAETYEVHFSVLSEVTADQRGNAIISTVVDATARPVNFPGDPVRCISKGELESRIVAVVRNTAGQ